MSDDSGDEQVEGLRARRKRETRAVLLDAARDLFEAQGFEATTIREVAAAAGVGTGTVFNYFVDKRELLFEALYDDLEAAREATLASIDEGAPALAQLERLGVGFFEAYARRPRLSRVLLGEALLADGEWARRFRGQVEGVAERAVVILSAAQARGEVGAEVEPRVATLAFISFYYFILLSHVQAHAQLPVDAMSRQLRVLLAQHLRVTSGEQDGEVERG